MLDWKLCQRRGKQRACCGGEKFLILRTCLWQVETGMQVCEINPVISLAQTKVKSEGDALECSLQGCRRGER